jgi:hypothetical protein
MRNPQRNQGLRIQEPLESFHADLRWQIDSGLTQASHATLHRVHDQLFDHITLLVDADG